MSKIKAITISTLGTEFVIHVPDEYDYRYASTDKWDRIIMSLVKSYNMRVGAKMPCYFKVISYALVWIRKTDWLLASSKIIKMI